jgi:hypothetical protein
MTLRQCNFKLDEGTFGKLQRLSASGMTATEALRQCLPWDPIVGAYDFTRHSGRIPSGFGAFVETLVAEAMEARMLHDRRHPVHEDFLRPLGTTNPDRYLIAYYLDWIRAVDVADGIPSPGLDDIDVHLEQVPDSPEWREVGAVGKWAVLNNDQRFTSTGVEKIATKRSKGSAADGK